MLCQPLLGAGADINAAPSKGKLDYRRVDKGLTSLTAAVKSGSRHLVEFMLESGADPNDLRGAKSATEQACMPEYTPMVRMLLAAGADPTQDSCIVVAIELQHYELIQELMTAEADLSKFSSTRDPL